jgi:UDPglucose 6-dehydrogenase/GDP-mannose 6-dehydrogenase
MKLTIIGTGYVGFVSGVCLASKGHDVTCLDLRQEVVDNLNRGKPHIHEEGLRSLLSNVLKTKRFRAKKAVVENFGDSELIIIAVGTPPQKGEINLAHVQNAAKLAGNYLHRAKRFVSVIVKSTVVPGTTDTFVRKILERVSGKKLGAFGLGMNPEFLREGAAVEDFLAPDRIVLGHETPETLRHLEELYATWKCDKLRVNSRTAEMIKYVSNCLLATQISAVNELANLAAVLGGIDSNEVMRGIHLDRRWNPILSRGQRAQPGILAYLKPGCGFGGSCFPKDVQALRSLGIAKKTPMRLLQAVLDINEHQPSEVAVLLKRQFGKLKGRRILVLGLAFKPGTDDVRESASLKIIRCLLESGAEIDAHDPVAAANAAAVLRHRKLHYIPSWQEELGDADGVVVATCWPEYRELAKDALSSARSRKIIVDARRMFRPDELSPAVYLTIGWTKRNDK